MSSQSQQDSTLLQRRKRDYIWLLICMIGSYIALGPVTTLFPPESLVPEALTDLTLLPWFYICFRVTSNFHSSRAMIILYAALLVFQAMFNGYVHFLAVGNVAELAAMASIGYAANIVGFGVVFYILLQDIFSQKHDLAYGLLGASNIYFLIPILFTYIYSLLAVHNPGLIGAGPDQVNSVLLNSFNYSWYVIAGIDYPGAIGDSIRQVAVLESISGNLFVVFIIGRLMVK